MRWIKTILKGHPKARGWPSLIDLHDYEGGITWRGIIEIARIRGRAPAGPKNRTAILANSILCHGLAEAIDVAYTSMIARRVRVFDKERDALEWLRSGTNATQMLRSTKSKRPAKLALRGRPIGRQ